MTMVLKTGARIDEPEMHHRVHIGSPSHKDIRRGHTQCTSLTISHRAHLASVHC